MTVHYEWDIETLDPETVGTDDPEIFDHAHRDALSEFRDDDLRNALTGPLTRLVLVRDVGNDLDGLTDRSWAYVKGGKLPERFAYYFDEDGAAVPKRFHEELAHWSAD